MSQGDPENGSGIFVQNSGYLLPRCWNSGSI